MMDTDDYNDGQSHPRILDESNYYDDGDDSKKEDGGHYTLDAADGGVTSWIKLTLISSVIV